MLSRLKHAIRWSRKAAGRLARRSRASAPPRRLTPEAAPLEGRALLTTLPTFPNGAPLFVTDVYNDILFRNPNAAELSTGTAFLRNGGTPDQFAHAIVTGTERKTIEVTYFYENYLNRTPDAAGLVFNVDKLNHGVSSFQLQLQFILSPEFQNAHVSNQSYVDALYIDVLGRAPDASGEAYWVTQLNGGLSRDAVARAFLSSNDYITRVVNSDYQIVLHRNAEPAAVAFWKPNLLNTGKDAELLVALLVSPENFNNIKNGNP
jgi:hypothetical protein